MKAIPTPDTLPCDAGPYLELDDETLDLLVGQHITRTICNLPKAGNAPDCSLHGERDHFAPDDSSRPRPIEGDGAEFVEAIADAHRLLEGSLEVVQHYTPGGLEAIVTLIPSEGAWRTAQAEAPAMEGRGAPASNAQTMRRLIVGCLLAVAGAPTTVAFVTPTSWVPEHAR